MTPEEVREYFRSTKNVAPAPRSGSRRRSKDRPGPEPRVYPHGTRQRYQGTRLVPGCRCDPCKQANAQYSRDLRQTKDPSP